MLTAQKDIKAITDKLPENTSPDAKAMPQLEADREEARLCQLDEYNTVVDNISLVMGGIDPQTKKYVGSETVIKRRSPRSRPTRR